MPINPNQNLLDVVRAKQEAARTAESEAAPVGSDPMAYDNTRRFELAPQANKEVGEAAPIEGVTPKPPDDLDRLARDLRMQPNATEGMKDFAVADIVRRRHEHVRDSATGRITRNNNRQP